MKKNINVFIFYIFLLPNMLFGRQDTKLEKHINIKAKMFKSSTDKLYSFNIDIYNNANTIKVVYSVLDSFIAKTMFDIFLSNANTTRLFNSRFFLDIDSIAIRNCSYKKDSIQFKIDNNVKYTGLIDSSFLPNTRQFDDMLPSDIIIVGGVFYKFTFKNDEKIIKTLAVISPTNNDYPFLARLISETFNLYKPTDNSLLNKANTNGRYYR